MKSFFIKLLAFLKGKKTTIATIIGALITFSLSRGYIDGEIASLLATIMVALGLTANVADNRLNINANKTFGK